MTTRIDCPSAQPGSRASRIFGVATGPLAERRIGYLTAPVEAAPEVLAKAGYAKPTELFRIAAPCAKAACRHYNGACTLGQRIVTSLPPVVSGPPPCQIRPTCRWHHEHGDAACLRCPQVVTDKVGASEAEIRIAEGPARTEPA
ncbi:hypothetical protein [Methylobacterium sp. WSM2598]|uniref:hypothetical protein n=1 Tax=Methylobacterium sp. WSM2598 TaxID=398261 RepID=UPI000366F99B|nr:hypothetical protein [Methylobacterium sp. WSM2598]